MVEINGTPVYLTAKEYEMLELLSLRRYHAHQGNVLKLTSTVAWTNRR